MLICRSVLVHLREETEEPRRSPPPSVHNVHTDHKKQQPSPHRPLLGSVLHFANAYTVHKKQVFPGLLGLFFFFFFSAEDTISRPSFGLATAHVVPVMESKAGEYLNTPGFFPFFLRTAKQFVFRVDSLIHHRTKGLCQHSHVVFFSVCLRWKLTKHYLLCTFSSTNNPLHTHTSVFMLLFFPLRPHSSPPNRITCNVALYLHPYYFWGVICMCFQHPLLLLPRVLYYSTHSPPA